MNNYTVIDASQIAKEKWQDFTDKNENCNIFSTPYMFEVYRETPNYEPFAFYAVDDQRQIKAMLTGVIETVKPGFLSSLSKRAVMMQAPIFDEIEAIDFLLSKYSKIMKHKVVYSKIRNDHTP